MSKFCWESYFEKIKEKQFSWIHCDAKLLLAAHLKRNKQNDHCRIKAMVTIQYNYNKINAYFSN